MDFTPDYRLEGTDYYFPFKFDAEITLQLREKCPTLGKRGTLIVTKTGASMGTHLFLPFLSLFKYDYAEMTANMAGLRRELLVVAMRPSRIVNCGIV
jgi:hypothetical protein